MVLPLPGSSETLMIKSSEIKTARKAKPSTLMSHDNTTSTPNKENSTTYKCEDEDPTYCKKLQLVFTDKFIFYCDYVSEAATRCKATCSGKLGYRRATLCRSSKTLDGTNMK